MGQARLFGFLSLDLEKENIAPSLQVLAQICSHCVGKWEIFSCSIGTLRMRLKKKGLIDA